MITEFPKNTRIIITILFSLFAMAVQAQVKSGLDLCLRDETTGEWLIGLFDEYAIYDCDYWSYVEAGKDRVVLTKDGQQMEIKLKKNAVVIDGVKHKTSVLTTKFLPDYPVKDETAFDCNLLNSEQEATLRIVHRSGKANIRVVSYFHQLVNNDVNNYNAMSDSLGRFEAFIPLVGQTGAMLFTNATPPIYHMDRWVWIPYVMEPGDKLLFFIDDIEGRIYVMGKSARMTNEFMSHPMYGYDMNYDERKQMDFTMFINKYNDEERILLQHRDSVIAAHPLLSKRYRDYTLGMKQSFFAQNLGQLRFNRNKVKREEIIAEANHRNLFNIDIPFMVLERYDRFIDDICEVAIEKYCVVGSGVPFLQNILKKAHVGRLNLSEEEKSLIESEMPAEVPRPDHPEAIRKMIEEINIKN